MVIYFLLIRFLIRGHLRVKKGDVSLDDKTIETMIIDLSDSNSISKKIAAVNNNVRFSILEILRDFQRKTMIKTVYSKRIPCIQEKLTAYYLIIIISISLLKC